MAQAALDQNFKAGALGESSTTPGLTLPFLIDEITGRLLVTGSGGGGTPGSPVNSVQFNDAGSFGGSADFTFDKTIKGLDYIVTGDDAYTYSYVESTDSNTWSEFGLFGSGTPTAVLGNSDGLFYLRNGATDPVNKSAILDFSDISTSDKTFTFPNKTGTFALQPLTETPSGTINSVNVTFTTTTAINAIYSFAINGQYIHPVEYSVAGSTITFVTAPNIAFAGTPFTIVYM